jgi:hypothetical protein
MKAPSVQVAGGKAASEQAAKDIAAARPVADKAASRITMLSRMRGDLERGMFTGGGADWKLQFGQYLNGIGIHMADDAVANTEAYIREGAGLTLEILKTGALGTGSSITGPDREYASGIAGGDIKITKEGLKRIIAINEQAAREAVLTWNRGAGSLKRGDVFNEIPMPPEWTPPVPPGATAPGANPIQGVTAQAIDAYGAKLEREGKSEEEILKAIEAEFGLKRRR